MKNITIGIAGTAKNTGKTTTMGTMMDQLKAKPNYTLALTSIGYDGENLDNVTGLPKPRIEVWPGVLVAVAEKCLKYSQARIEVLETTNISTALGKIVIGKVTKGGKLLVAGPNKSKELRIIIDTMVNWGANITIVDGALNRIAPMVEVDGLLLATGAARNTEITQLAYETQCIIDVLQCPVMDTRGDVIKAYSVLNSKGLEVFLDQLRLGETADIKGVFGEKSLLQLVERAREIKGKRLIFTDPIKLLLAGEITQTHKLLTLLKKQDIEIGVKKSIKIIAVTVNPYYPKFRFSSEDYEPAYVDKEQLYATMGQSINIPCYDVVKEGGQGILDNLLDYWKGLEKIAAK